MMKNEIETVRRELEQCEASLLMLQRGERIQLLPEPQKKRFIEKKKRVEETNDDDDDDDDNNNNKSFWQHSLFGKSAKTYLQKAKKKIDSVASKTKKTIKNALNEYNNKDEQQKKIEVEERYSETQRERERRDEEEIRKLRQYGYKSDNNMSYDGDDADDDDDEDGEARRRKQLFSTRGTGTTTTSSTTRNNNYNNNSSKYDMMMNSARESTETANRSAIALQKTLQIAEQAERAGIDALENLRKQRETLKSSSNSLKSANDTMDQNQKLLKKMGHWSRLGC